ncbi:MAG: hypothetical protein JNK58_06405 [Phycisphaerae bacterium]|nr:hypothetical protein [Phycisphaerae bacterium]
MQTVAATSTRNEAVSASIAVLEQCACFLQGIDPTDYQAACDLLAGSSIGQHVRHALDHFSAILQPAQPGIVDYDHRQRDTPIERQPNAAGRLIDEMIRALESLRAPGRPIHVRVMLTSDGRDTLLASSIERELAFATHHAIHHHAMIAAIARTLDLDVPARFGLAPSTEHHRLQSVHAPNRDAAATADR